MKDIQVLVVEDDPMISFLHKTLLIREKISPSPGVFKNGKIAWDYMTQDDLDDTGFLVLLDLNMPVMNGWELLEKIEGHDLESRSRVVVVTSSVDKADERKAEQFDVVEKFLTKPILDFEEIKEVKKKLEKQFLA